MKSLILALGLIFFTTASPLFSRSSTTGYVSGPEAHDVENGNCAPLTVIFARGTNDLGNIGLPTGEPLFKELSRQLNGQVVLQGVNYPADYAGIIIGGGEGAGPMKAIAEQALAQCSTTKLAVAGHSQGAQVVHFTLLFQLIPSGDVSSATYFGDPYPNFIPSGTLPAERVKKYCNHGDYICELPNGIFTNPGTITGNPHVSYGENATAAAQYIISTAGITV